MTSMIWKSAVCVAMLQACSIPLVFLGAPPAVPDEGAPLEPAEDFDGSDGDALAPEADPAEDKHVEMADVDRDKADLVNAIWFFTLTASDSGAGTSSSISAVVAGKTISLNSNVRVKGQGRWTRHSARISPELGLKLEDFIPNDAIALKTRSDDAWLPARIVCIVSTAHGFYHCVLNEPTWEAKKWFSTDANDGPADDVPAQSQWTIVRTVPTMTGRVDNNDRVTSYMYISEASRKPHSGTSTVLAVTHEQGMNAALNLPWSTPTTVGPGRVAVGEGRPSGDVRLRHVWNTATYWLLGDNRKDAYLPRQTFGLARVKQREIVFVMFDWWSERQWVGVQPSDAPEGAIVSPSAPINRDPAHPLNKCDADRTAFKACQAATPLAANEAVDGHAPAGAARPP